MTTPAGPRTAPATDNQKHFLSDCGLTPAEIAKVATFQQASDLLDELVPRLAAFRDAHGGQKWATGKQRGLAQRRGIRLPEGLTCSEARDYIDGALKSLPPTEEQLNFLKERKYPGVAPITREEARQLVQSLLSKASSATPRQIRLIKELSPSIPEAALLGMTFKLAYAVIDKLLSQKRRRGQQQTDQQQQKPDGDGDGV